MARKVVDLTIRLKDGVTGTLNKINSGLKNTQAVAVGLAKAAAVGFAAIGTAAAAVGVAVNKAFQFETAQVQLKSLLGSTEAAQKRFEELKRFSAETPFQLQGILQASRLLTVFSENAMGGADSLRSIGDAAAVSGQSIEDVSFWVGRAYSMLKGGKPFGEAAMRLQEMGILTAAGRTEIENMVKAGAPLEETFGRLQEELGRFDGGMKALSETGAGLVSTLKDNWTIAVAEFGEELMVLSKDSIQEAIDQVKRLTESGDIAYWASEAARTFSFLKDAIESIAGPISKVVNAVTGGIRAIGGFIGGVAGGVSSGEGFGAIRAGIEQARIANDEYKARKDAFKKAYQEERQIRKLQAESLTQEEFSARDSEIKEETQAQKEAIKEVAEEADIAVASAGETFADSLSEAFEEKLPEISSDILSAGIAAPVAAAVAPDGGGGIQDLGGATDLFSALTRGGELGGLTSGKALEEIKELLHGSPEQMAEALQAAMEEVFSSPIEIEAESLRSELGQMKDILDDMLELQADRLGGVLN